MAFHIQPQTHLSPRPASGTVPTSSTPHSQVLHPHFETTHTEVQGKANLRVDLTCLKAWNHPLKRCWIPLGWSWGTHWAEEAIETQTV